MTSKIILKKSVVENRVPVPGDLEYGELALNYKDGKLYYKRSDGVSSSNDSVDYFVSGSLQDTNTTYSLDGSGTTNSVNLELIAGGSGSGTDTINLVGSGVTSLSWDENSQRITVSTVGGTFTEKTTFPSAVASRPQLPGGFLGLDIGDGNFDIWGISRDYYPSNPTASDAWGIVWNGDSNEIRFIGAGNTRLSVDLDGEADGLKWNNNTVLHAGNYNSYSPSLTGTGASGTWSINITGNAATASNSNTVGGLTKAQLFNNMGNNHGTYTDFNNIPDFGTYYVQAGTNSPTGVGDHQWYGFTLGLGNEYPLSSYGTQLYWPRAAQNSNTYLWVRDREGGSWGSWRKILAGYADTAGSATDSTKLPLSGGTMTGTLVGVSGTTLGFDGGSCAADSYNYVFAAGNDSGNRLVAFVNGSARSNDGGTNSVTIRNDGGALNLGNSSYSVNLIGTGVSAPIIYDSNDTSYYVDPANTSTSLNLAGYAYVGKGIVSGQYLTLNHDQLWAQGTLHFQYSSAGNIDMNQGGGYTFSRTSLRAPIFYDSDNTSYYVDPNSTSNLVGLTVVNTITGNISGNADTVDGRHADYFYPASTPNGYSAGDINGNTTHQRLWGTDSVQNLLQFRPPTTIEYSLDGVTWTASTISADVFDGKVFGKWGGLTLPVGNNIGAWRYARLTWNSFGYHFWSHLTLAHSTNGHSFNLVFYKSSTDGSTWTETFRQNGINSWPGYTFTKYGDVSGWWDTRDVRIVFELNHSASHPDNPITIGHIGLMGSYSSFTRLYDWDGSRNVTFGGNITAPVLYDSNNTAYYVDPNSTSRLNIVHANYFLGEITDSGGGDSNAPYRFESDYSGWATIFAGTPGSSNGWGTFWAGNDNATYRYFDTVNPNEYVFVGNGTVRASIDLDNGQSYFGTSIRSPIFYDSDNTAYYVDPSPTGARAAYLNGNLWINPKSESYGEGIAFLMPSQGTWGGIRWTRSTSDFTGAWAFGYFGNESNNDIGFHNSNIGNGWRLDHSFNNTITGSVRSPIFYDSDNTAYYVNPGADLSVKVYGEISNSNFAEGNMQPGALNIGRTDLDYGWDNTSWAGDVRAGILANCNETWEFVIHDSGDSIESVFRYDGGDQLLMGRDIGWGTLYIQAANSFRAPIFYDSNDTSFYVDPASTATSIQIAGTIEQGNNYAHPNVEWSASGTSTGEIIFYLPGTTSNYGMVHMVFDVYEYNGNATSTITLGGHNWNGSWYNVTCDVVGQFPHQVRLGSKDGRYVVVFGDSTTSWSYGTIRLRKIHNGGFYNNQMDLGGNWSAVQSTANSFSTITSDLRGLRTPAAFIAGGYVTGSRLWSGYDSGESGSVSANNWFRSSGNTGWYNASYAGGIYMEDSTWVRVYGNKQFYSSNLIESGTDVRAPIFYDSNDTSYYIDPNSTSNSALRIRGGTQHGPNPTWGAYLYVGTDGRVGSEATVAVTNGNLHLDSKNGYQMYLNWYSTENIYTQGNLGLGDSSASYRLHVHGTGYATSDFRTPIFYDSNDTSFYLDPASTSRLNTVSASRFKNIYDTATNHTFGLFFGSDESSAYAIYREPGAWDWPYPDLRIAFHTGIKIGANAGYQGVKFYTDYDMATQVMSVNNGSDPLGAGNVFVNYSLQADSSLRAPIFYDSNNTAYYLDPSSTSTSLNIAGGIVTPLMWVNYSTSNYNNYNEGIRLYSADNGAAVITFNTAGTTGSSYSSIIGYTDRLEKRWAGQWQERMYNGYTEAYGSFRAPIFYDSNNTSYYADPASTSVFNNLTVNTINASSHIHDYISPLGRISAETGRSVHRTGVYTFGTYTAANPGGNPPLTYPEVIAWGNGTGGSIQIAGDWISTTSTPLRVRSLRDCCQDWSSWSSIATSNESFTNNVDLRAPIFYDSNNTAYYWDGASTSKWSESNQDGWHTFNNYGLGVTGTYDSYRLQTVFAMGAAYRMASDGSATNNMYGLAWSHPNAGSLGGANNLNDHGLLIINNGSFRAAISSRAVFSADVRGTMFYDYNDTSYYTDPASTSVLNAAQIASLGVGTAASGTAGEIRATNNITAYYSDDRLKTNLGNITNALEKVLSLNGFYYEANETAQSLGYKVKREVGLSAQQVEKVLPEIVVPAPIDEKYKTLHYERVIPLLVEAIKEQQSEIDELKSLVKQLLAK